MKTRISDPEMKRRQEKMKIQNRNRKSQWKKYYPGTQAWENHGDISVNTGLGACGWFENNSYIPKQEKYRIEAGKMADRPHLIMKHS